MSGQQTSVAMTQEAIVGRSAVEFLQRALSEHGYALFDSVAMDAILRETGVAAWPTFADSWNDLPLDADRLSYSPGTMP
ncbi:hypothetical protein [uncultured Sphingomonas sp.]|uniref:hypothetical protein n=1 Tax=uncultured Sphingomonas sp. TaxID=158754 RepID=UPI0035C9B60A